jgi:hypothetical protein
MRVVVACALILPALTLGAQQPVFRAGIDVVTIDASVMDGKKPVATMTKDDFNVTDDGVAQTLLDVGREQLPLDVTLTIDISGSVTADKRATIERGIRQVADTLRPDDRCSIVTFHSHVAEDMPLTRPPLSVTLTGQPNGGTSFIDTLLLSLVTTPVMGRRQLNLFLTDGVDSTSFFAPALVLDTMKFASGQTSMVLVRGPGTNPGVNLADGPVRDMLKAVTATSGGQIVELDREEALKDTFLAALEEFRTSYLLRYAPTGVPRKGWHPVVVTVPRSKYSVRARLGYWSR